MIRTSGAYLAAVLLTYLVATLLSSQWLAWQLQSIGIPLNWQTRVNISLQDIAGMAGVFLPMVAAGLALALPAAGRLARRCPRWRNPLYAFTAAAALVAGHLALRLAFDVTPVVAARLAPALLPQALAGALGGYCFARLSNRGRLVR